MYLTQKRKQNRYLSEADGRRELNEREDGEKIRARVGDPYVGRAEEREQKSAGGHLWDLIVCYRGYYS